MKTAKTIFLTTLTYLLATAVVLSCLHAKDLVGYRVTLTKMNATTETRVGEIVAKAMSDLHTHVDKASMSLKNIVKSIGDQTTLAYDRHLQTLRAKYGRNMAVILMETLLLFRIAFATIR